jgi:UDP-N-acetylmuramyl pentapeptide phosphotransferase/UDP-N-acetylglucosamine-1-phosphate transferase
MMQWIVAACGVMAAFIVPMLVCKWIIYQKKEGWLDKPNDRSLHDTPVPRLGGIGIWSGVAVGTVITCNMLQQIIDIYCLVAAILLFFVALLDDRKTLPPWMRLLAQFFAATLAVFGAKLYVGWEVAAWIWPLVGILVLLWGINLYNFMDGIDGFAGMMAVIGFFALAILGLLHGQISFLFLCSLLIAASAGFLYFNFPPAKIFMGDSGSTVMGFAMVAVSITGWKQGIYPFWIPLVIFSPFWVDATATLLMRLYRREKVWLPHRQHFYQRCVLAGYSHRQVTMAYGSIMLLCSVSSVVWQFAGRGYNESVLPVSWMVFYGLILFVSNHIIERKQRQSG